MPSEPWLRPLVNPTILVTSIVYGVLVALASRASLFGIWLFVLVAASLWRYAYAVLRGAAQGRAALPPPDIDSMNPVGDWRLLAHAALFVGATVIAADAPVPSLGVALLVAIACVFPASAALMGLGADLVLALNPAAVVGVARTLGRDYIALIGGCGGIVLIGMAASTWLLPRLGLLAGVAGSVLGVWTMLAVFALIGATIRRHRDAFDIPGEIPDRADRARRESRRGWQTDLDQIYAVLRGGDVEQGYVLIRDLIARNGASVEVHFWLLENMLDWQDRQHAFRVGERLVARLVEVGDLPAALDVLARCRRLGGRLTVRPGTLRLLVRYAREIGQAGLASELLAELEAPEGHSV